MEVPGWFVLRTRRHAETIAGLDDAEADALGRRMRTLVAAVAEVTGAPATYQLVFGEDNRHFHTLVTARGEHIPGDRRRGDILKLLDDGQRDLAACQAIVAKVRAAYTRITEHEQLADTVS
jgi:diadenosine tetraphosphate (Ap4A) HIT family hydrolase